MPPNSPPKVIFIFRRDLRWNDNIGLTKAYEYVKSHPGTVLYPIFVFNERQIDPKRNKYYSANTVRFLVECIREDLMPFVNIYHEKHSEQHTKTLASIERNGRNSNIAAVFFNRDYSPFARARDEEIIDWCTERNIHVHGEWNEYSLVDIPNMPKPYKVYGAFLKAYASTKVPLPLNNESKIKAILKPATSGTHTSMSKLSKYYGNIENAQAAVKGGRQHAKERLHLIDAGKLDNYATTRDYPAMMVQAQADANQKQSTTMMSAYLKYGCVSIREFYHTLKSRKAAGSKIIRELFWRAYYEQMAYHFPHTLSGQLDNNHNNYNSALNPKNDSTKWHTDTRAADAIMAGKTGIPIVDAAVRQLITTGFMHNRLRMVVAMLACRILKMDWRIFERWFATHLIDYYSIVNRMSWEWSVTYRFTLNPWVQQKKFDKDAVFIKHWLPEFKDVPTKDIHAWYDAYKNYAFGTKPLMARTLA